MRKLLLATVAMLGATSGVAMAQGELGFAPSQGMSAMPASPTPPASSFNASNAYGNVAGHVGAAAYGMMKPPTPGTVVIHLGGKVEVDMMAQWTTNNQVSIGGVTAKTNPIVFSSYMRLYPGVDGMTTNGLRYGASIELRENFPGTTAQPAPALVPAPSAATYLNGQTVYVRRAFTYLANDNLGIVRFGTTDGVIGLFDPCIFYGGCWDAGHGNINGAMFGGAGVIGAAVPYVYLAQSGTEYGNTKVVYLSPQFFGFDFGVQYAPSMGNGYSTCATANTSCNSATTGTDATRWYNQVGVGVHYQGVFGPVGVGAYAFYEAASKESFFGPAVTSGRGLTGNRFDNLSFISAAAYVNFDTGVGKVTWSVDYIGGATNGAVTMRPTGGVSQNAVVTGLMYQNGPLTLGFQTQVVESQGQASLTSISQRHEWEIGFGGNYNVAPGLYLVGEYMYAQRHQGGFDFVAGAQSPAAPGSGPAGSNTWKAGTTRDSRGQAILFSTVVNW